MTLGDEIDSNGARPVRTPQAGAVPGSVPQRSPPKRLEVPSSSCGARRRGGHATGRTTNTSKEKDKPGTIIMHWNAEGITNKKTELEHFLHENSVNICCLQETHLQEGKPFKIRGYQVFRNDRQGRRKGGVMTLVKNNLNASETKKQTGEAEYIQTRVTTTTCTLDLVNYYCPNDKSLSLDTIQVPDSGFLIAGDFNSQSQSWGYDTLDKRGEEIEAWQDENHLILANDLSDEHTFYSRRWHSTTTPDLALCTEDIHKQLNRKVGPQLGGSDHRPVLLEISGKPPADCPQHPRWNYKKARWGLFAIRTNELSREITVDGRNINNVVRDFNASIIKAAKETIPRGVRKNYTPYWTPKLQDAQDKLTRAREEAETNPSQENNIKLQQCKAQYLKTKLECTRKSWREKTEKLNMERDTTKMWRLARALNDEGYREQKITLEENNKILMGKIAADTFAKAYAEESNTTVPRQLKKEMRQEERERRKTAAPDAMKEDLTMAELKKAIKQLKKKKSPGPDGVTNEMLQHLGNTTMQKLLDIFNLSWRSGQVPQCWKDATMIPVLKQGKNRAKAASYRPISLTSCICKTIERIINQRMQWYLESESIILPEQAAFRRYKSTEDQTTHLAQTIEDAFQAQKVTLTAFIDLQKAFDKMWKDGLLVKLLRSGIQGNMYRWTKSYLHNRRARVLVDGRCGRKVLLRQGVPQGGVLSPTLFILFMNDLVPELPKGIHAALYADDLVLWCTEEYATTATYRMQQALDKLTAWTNTWCVTINKEKSSATLFSLSTKTKAGHLHLENTPLLYEDQQTYLGVTFDKRLTWKQHVQNAEAKARRKINIMRKLAGTQWGANERILKSVYQGSVRPHLEYGSSSWMTAAQTHQQTLQRVQNQALRIITGAMRSTPIEKMEGTTGILPLKNRWECKALIQYTKAETSANHLMHTRTTQTSSGRLKRSSFIRDTRLLQRRLQEQLPREVEVIQPDSGPPPWIDKLRDITIHTTVPHLTTKDEHSDVSKRALTLAMLEERYPQEAWIRAYTDGSATNAVWRGGAGVYIQFPDGRRQARAIPTGLHCTNYRAEVEALVHAANTIKEAAHPCSQVVLLTDAKSVLEAASNLPQLQGALHDITCTRLVLQWIPSHCGIRGNEEADRMAKLGADKEQTTNNISLPEMNTIIKTLFRTPQSTDSYHQLTRQEQVIIFRLRTGHNRLNCHMNKRFRLAPSPRCPCGEADQTAEHVLQECGDYRPLRARFWPRPMSFRDKLYGPVEVLQTTAQFILESRLQV